MLSSILPINCKWYGYCSVEHVSLAISVYDTEDRADFSWSRYADSS
jgi:hypothetical protein